MNKFLTLAYLLISMSYVFSQDTIIDYSKRTVTIIDTINKLEIVYQFKDDYKIEHGKYMYDYFSRDNHYTTVRFYKDGKSHGKLTAFTDGKLTYISHHKNGKLHGKEKEYLHGQIILKGNYKNGIKRGKWIYLNFESLDEGAILEKGRFSGKVINLQIEDGNLFKITFHDDTTMTLERFNDNSLINYLRNLYDIYLIRVGDYYLKKGIWKYYQNGKLIKKVHFMSNGTIGRVILL